MSVHYENWLREFRAEHEENPTPDQIFNGGMERAAEMLDLNYPLCAKWIRKEIEK